MSQIDPQKDIAVTNFVDDDVSKSVSEDADPSKPGHVDAAWKFLDQNRDVAANNVTVDIDALRRKIDWHIVPLMFCCYTMQFLDKVILNVSLPAMSLLLCIYLTRFFCSTLP